MGYKMASRKIKLPVLNTTRNLGYAKCIAKIPEYGRITDPDFIYLLCATQYSLIVLFEDPFELFSILYGITDLRKKVLLHIKKNRKYYQEVSKTYLNLKKIDLIHWIASMTITTLPVDELCLYALCIYLNLHVTVDYLGGIWSTLDIPNIQHDLAVILSDLHLAYRGFWTYGLLCKNMNLRTIGKRLMEHKIQANQNILVRANATVLLRCVEEWNALAEKLVNDGLSSLKPFSSPDSDDTEIYDTAQYAEANSDSTETYDIDEQVIGTITYSNTKLLFKCPIKSCNIRCETRKKISSHYKQSHRKIHKCGYRHRIYSTPYSLLQHSYKHKILKNRFMCKCSEVFPFKSQLRIHKIKHTKKLTNLCTECGIPFKQRHDMLKHLRSHTAEELSCEHCDYAGNIINLKAHQKQHNSKYNIKCDLCKESFKHRMSHWRHKRICR